MVFLFYPVYLKLMGKTIKTEKFKQDQPLLLEGLMMGRRRGDVRGGIGWVLSQQQKWASFLPIHSIT
jgi:hypothetical protein